MHLTDRGVTLMHLLVGLAVLGVLSATALLSYQHALSGWRLSAAARQVVMDLKLARARAILDSSSLRVYFTVPGSSYQHERQQPSGSNVAVGRATTLPSDVTIIGCTAVGGGISFRPRGHAGAFGTVMLRNADGDQRAVVVDIVGRTRVQ